MGTSFSHYLRSQHDVNTVFMFVFETAQFNVTIYQSLFIDIKTNSQFAPESFMCFCLGYVIMIM